MKIFTILLILFFLLFSYQILAKQCGPKRISFSFDDAPKRASKILTGEQRTQLLIDGLKSAKIDEAIFYVNTKRMNKKGKERVLAYAENGHLIGNHTHQHKNLHQVGAQAFINDIEMADALLKKLPAYKKIFRFPFLNEGRTKTERNEVRAALLKLGYTQGYVTVDNFDFYIDKLFKDALNRGDSVDYNKIGQFYAKAIVSSAEHYNALACVWLKRSPAHTLLLHENDVAALFIIDLARALRSAGWVIISSSEAYSDPISKQPPDTLLLGQGRVAALAYLAGAPEVSLRNKAENKDFLKKKFDEILLNK
jgi:peptidoglycan/xylan/chitin deacetylase (PgdA/CDA1 family)